MWIFITNLYQLNMKASLLQRLCIRCLITILENSYESFSPTLVTTTFYWLRLPT